MSTICSGWETKNSSGPSVAHFYCYLMFSFFQVYISIKIPLWYCSLTKQTTRAFPYGYNCSTGRCLAVSCCPGLTISNIMTGLMGKWSYFCLFHLTCLIQIRQKNYVHFLWRAFIAKFSLAILTWLDIALFLEPLHDCFLSLQMLN